MANTLKSRLERLEQQQGSADNPTIVKIVHFAPFKEGDGVFVDGQFYAKPADESIEELKRKVLNDLRRSGPRRLIVIGQYEQA